MEIHPLFAYLYQNAEIYAVILTWIVIPLGTYVFFQFFNEHFGMFEPRPEPAPEVSEPVKEKVSAKN